VEFKQNQSLLYGLKYCKSASPCYYFISSQLFDLTMVQLVKWLGPVILSNSLEWHKNWRIQI